MSSYKYIYIRTVICGNPGVGKTSFVRSLITEEGMKEYESNPMLGMRTFPDI
jgi:GTPase SAR1 family protein